jgi:type IV pilus assembly protein PilB
MAEVSKKRLGEMLLETGAIDELQQIVALGEQKRWGGKLGSVLIHLGFVNENSIASVLEKQFRQKCISLKHKEIPQDVISMVRPDIAKQYCIMPLSLDKRTLTIAITDPNDLGTIDDLAFMLGLNIKPLLAIEYDIKNAIFRYYG